MNRIGMMIWLGLCAFVAVVSGTQAVEQLAAAEQLRIGPGPASFGSEAFWHAFLGFQGWGSIAYVAVMVGLLSLGMLTQPQLRVWLAVCGVVGVWYGVAAIDRLLITKSFTGSGATGSWGWWETYLEFHNATWRSFGILGLGVVSVGGAALLPMLEAALPAPQRTPGSPHRPLGVTVIVLYLVLATLVYLVPLLAQPLGLAGSEWLGASPRIGEAAISVALALIPAWGLWQCRSWARTLMIWGGIPLIGLSFLGGTAGFKNWIFLAIVLYLVQRRIGEVFSPTPDPLP